MGKITDIKPQARNKTRVSVYIDGRFCCGLEKLTVALHRLKIGDEIEPEALESAIAESESASAFDRAAKYLGARSRTEKEIAEYLAQKGYSENAAKGAVEKLLQYGYVNDAEYCRMYVEAYRNKSGARKLEAELRQKGVSRDIIEEELARLDDQTADVLRLAEKWLSSHSPDRRKLTAFLLSKGFSYDDVRESLSELSECFDSD